MIYRRQFYCNEKENVRRAIYGNFRGTVWVASAVFETRVPLDPIFETKSARLVLRFLVSMLMMCVNACRCVCRQKYGWTGKNCYFIKGNTDSLSVGAAE